MFIKLVDKADAVSFYAVSSVSCMVERVDGWPIDIIDIKLVDKSFSLSMSGFGLLELFEKALSQGGILDVAEEFPDTKVQVYDKYGDLVREVFGCLT